MSTYIPIRCISGFARPQITHGHASFDALLNAVSTQKTLDNLDGRISNFYCH